MLPPVCDGPILPRKGGQFQRSGVAFEENGCQFSVAPGDSAVFGPVLAAVRQGERDRPGKGAVPLAYLRYHRLHSRSV